MKFSLNSYRILVSNGPGMGSTAHTTIKPSSLVEMSSAMHTSSTPPAGELTTCHDNHHHIELLKLLQPS